MNSKNRLRFLSMLTLTALLFTSVGLPAVAATDNTSDHTLSDNAVIEDAEYAEVMLGGVLTGDLSNEQMFAAEAHRNNRNGHTHYGRYGYAARPVASYIEKVGTGYMKVNAGNDAVNVTYLDDKFSVKSDKTVKMELPIFGGFYMGKDAYYIVFGKSNEEHSDSAEVIRVVKYDTNWNKTAETSIKGFNTAIPFRAASLRITEYGGHLYVRTAHQMYNGHQASVMLDILESDMTLVDSLSEVVMSTFGYVSHSFDQYLVIDDKQNIICLDHGDAYPRSAVLNICGKKAGTNDKSGYATAINLIEYYPLPMEDYSYNYTGANVGGLTFSESAYLTVGSIVTQDEKTLANKDFNVYITVTNRANNSTTVLKLTSFDGKAEYAGNPFISKINNNKFLVVWPLLGTKEGKIQYLYVDGSGKPLGNVYTAAGYLSDCQPIVDGEAVIWYEDDGTKSNYYVIDGEGKLSVNNKEKQSTEETPETEEEVESEQAGVLVAGQKVDISKIYATYNPGKYKISNKNVAKVSKTGIVTTKKAGSFTIAALEKVDGVWKTINGAPVIEYEVVKPVMSQIKLTYKDEKVDAHDFVENLPVSANVVWSVKTSKNNPVVAVDEKTGMVTALRSGSATLCMKIGEEGLAKVYKKKITVKIPNLSVKDDTTIKENASKKITLKNVKADTNVEWSVSNTAVLDLVLITQKNNQVKIIGKSAGTAVVTARVEGHSYSARIIVNEK